jgi:hypothetical protein
MGKELLVLKILAMEFTPKLARDTLIERMREKGESLLGQVADAVNAAPPGQVISGSEVDPGNGVHFNSWLPRAR